MKSPDSAVFPYLPSSSVSDNQGHAVQECDSRGDIAALQIHFSQAEKIGCVQMSVPDFAIIEECKHRAGAILIAVVPKRNCGAL